MSFSFAPKKPLHEQLHDAQSDVASAVTILERNERILKRRKKDYLASNEHRQFTPGNVSYKMQQKFKKVNEAEGQVRYWTKSLADSQKLVAKLEFQLSHAGQKRKALDDVTNVAALMKVKTVADHTTGNDKKRKAPDEYVPDATGKLVKKVKTEVAVQSAGVFPGRKLGKQPTIRRTTVKVPVSPKAKTSTKAGASTTLRATTSKNGDGRRSTGAADADAKSAATSPSSPDKQASTTACTGPRMSGAEKATGKRKADNDKDQEPKKRVKCANPKGLVNISNACFANAGLQLLNRALNDKEVENLATGTTARIFGLDSLPAKKADLRHALKNAQVEIAKNAAEKDINIDPYLHKVLAELRHETSKSTVDPLVLQQVFAHSAKADEKNRKAMDGTTQQDAHLFTTAMLGAISGEKKIAESFAVKQQTEIKCQYEGCRRKSTVQEEVDMVVRVHVPEVSEVLNLDALLRTAVKAHQVNLDDRECEWCGNAGHCIKQTTFGALPDRLLVHVARANYHPNRRSSYKIKSRVAPTLGEIALNGGKYRMIAMTVHQTKSTSADSGHYVAYVLRNEQWFLLDDEEVTPTGKEQLADEADFVLLQRCDSREQS